MGYRKPVSIWGPFTVVQDQETKLYHVVDLNGEDVWRTPFRKWNLAMMAAQSFYTADDLPDAGGRTRRIVVRMEDGAVFRSIAEAAQSTGISRCHLSEALRKSKNGHARLGGYEWEYGN